VRTRQGYGRDRWRKHNYARRSAAGRASANAKVRSRLGITNVILPWGSCGALLQLSPVTAGHNKTNRGNQTDGNSDEGQQARMVHGLSVDVQGIKAGLSDDGFAVSHLHTAPT
jgi:hypothetical protein